MKKLLVVVMVPFFIGCSGEEFNSDIASTADSDLDKCLSAFSKFSVTCAMSQLAKKK